MPISPDAIYTACVSEQKHYDTLSLAAVTGMVIAASFPFALRTGSEGLAVRTMCYCGAIAAATVSYIIYWNLAKAANGARVIASRLECDEDLEDGDCGYSSAMVSGQGKSYAAEVRTLQRHEKPLSIRYTVTILYLILIAGLVWRLTRVWS